jgi:hypothetical protein
VQKLLVTSKILNLIIHYELNNFELLDYLIKSTYRFLKKAPYLAYNEKTAIEFIKRLPNITSQAELSELFKDSLHELHKYDIEEDNTGGFEIKNNFTNIAEFDLESWLESKISGKALKKL